MRPGRGVVLSLFFVLSSSSSQVARAEGSAEFDVADVVGTHLANDQALTQDTALFVDILDGNTEQICWRGTGAVIVSQPNGTVIDTIDSAPGPANPQCAPAVGGVNGAYRLQMQSPQLIGTEWDLRVCPKTVGATVIDASACFTGSTNERVGRLWSYDWNFQENTNFANNYSINGSVFAIVPGGEAGRDAVIEMQMRGVSGAQYHLLANGVGPEQNTSNTRIGRSVPSMVARNSWVMRSSPEPTRS